MNYIEVIYHELSIKSEDRLRFHKRTRVDANNRVATSFNAIIVLLLAFRLTYVGVKFLSYGKLYD